MSDPFRILILCTGNSARSQIAEALLQRDGGERIAVVSAGSHPAEQVNPHAVEILGEHGIPWQDKRPRAIDGLEADPWDLVITVCDNAREACPVFPAARVQAHWGMEDPAAVAGPAEVRRAAFTETYRVLEGRIGALLALPLETLDAGRLAQEAEAIGRPPG